MKRLAAIFIVCLLALVGAEAVSWVAQGRTAFGSDSAEFRAKLPEKVDPSKVLFLGNSMFKTGFDFAQMDALTGRKSQFFYYNGEYDSLWYLILRNALLSAPAAERPSFIVWGFRPTYSMRPAFRQTRAGPIEQFLDPGDSGFFGLAQMPATSGESNPMELSSIYRARKVLEADLRAAMSSLGLDAVRPLQSKESYDALAKMVAQSSLTDVIVKVTTEGRVAMAEEAVVDAGEQFYVGENRTFDQSFVPVISRMIAESGIPQFVVIFRPREDVEGRLSAEARTFTDEAVAYFEAQGIPFINFVGDGRIDEAGYASGDHYNEQGRANVTDLVGTALRPLIEQQSGR